jgi:hypothetical protein
MRNSRNGRSSCSRSWSASSPEALPALGAGWPSGHFTAWSLSLSGLAIRSEDVERLTGQRADILVTHEAPTSHPAGFVVLEQLARRMGATLLVHGHHHVTYNARADDGLRVSGVASAWGMRADGSIAWPGETPRLLPALPAGWQMDPLASAREKA